jgi:hypothetical protein
MKVRFAGVIVWQAVLRARALVPGEVFGGAGRVEVLDFCVGSLVIRFRPGCVPKQRY